MWRDPFERLYNRLKSKRIIPDNPNRCFSTNFIKCVNDSTKYQCIYVIFPLHIIKLVLSIAI